MKNRSDDYISIAKETLRTEADALLDAEGRVSNEMNTAVACLLKCKGKLIITGVGKSGLIGAKMAATFASTGTPSFFLHPTEALHGDLGMIGPDDVVLAISYSGESGELSAILPHIKRFNIPLIGMTRSTQSTLGKFADIVLCIEIAKEACPLGIAPTSSTTLTLALGDALAICMMHARDFQKEDFASFHPGGALGRQLFVKVSDLMRRDDLPFVKEEALVKDAILSISEGRLGTALLVDDNKKLLGLISDGDIRRALLKEGFSLDEKISKYATMNPMTIKDEDLLASDALILIEKKKIQLMVVTDENNSVKGVLHIHNLIEEGIK